MTAATARVSQAEIEDLQIVAGDHVDAYSAVVAMHPAAVARVLEETGRAIGIDVAGLLAPALRSATLSEKASLS